MRRTISLAAAAVVLMAVGLAVSVTANGQSIPDVNRALHALLPQVEQLVTTTHNLNQMEEMLQGTPEFSVAHNVMSTSFAFQGAVHETHLMGRILINMTCPADAQY